MLRVPDWLFVLLASFSIFLLAALISCLIWCILVRTRRAKYALQRSPLEQQFLIQPGQSSAACVTPSYIPYTVPKIVQSAITKPSSVRSPMLSMNYPISGRYIMDNGRNSDYAGSCKSEPIINRAYGSDDKFVLRPIAKQFDIYPSRPSSRASSLRSEPIDHIETEPNHNILQSKEVYLHSSLLQNDNVDSNDKDEFMAKDHIVSYDQNTEPTGEENKLTNGALIISLFYDSEASELVVTIRQAVDLPLDYMKEAELDVHVNFCIVPEDFYWQRTVSVSQTRNPVFEQIFHVEDVLHHKLRQYTLCFLVMTSSDLQETMLGKVMVPLSELRSGIEFEMCRELGRN
eukprot:Seg321.8 transcript_id=Seg321.8/GoldUCD/mRNA.D3Y31 product=Synaptotagmin-11 protein_id=Seg321.8/GoldUCD/D3Y31